MIFPKKQELEDQKRRLAGEVRNELKAQKLRLEFETASQRAFKELELKKLAELEELYTATKDQRERSRRTMGSTVSKRSNQYLEKLNSIQKQAKEFMRQATIKDNFPKPPPLEISAVELASKTIDHIRVPVLVPRSILRKAMKESPPVVNHVTRTGEVMSVHLVTEAMPTFDPLVSAEAQILKRDLGTDKSVLADIQYSGNRRNRLLKSVSPIKHKENGSLDLTQPEGLHVIRELTPKDKVERYNFRENSVSDISVESHRSWVSQRMKAYAEKIKEACKPQASPRKQIEMLLLIEKQKRDKPVATNRVKLHQIA
jgi:hypothetical protein